MSRMRLWIAAGSLAGLLCGPAAHANYVINLKNGNAYFTSRYWQEGRQIFFDVYGGIFGVDKAFVRAIDKSTARQSTQLITQPAITEARTVARPENESAPSKDSQPQSVPQPGPDDPVVREFNQLKERSKQVGSLLTTEILALLKEITAFKNKLSKDSQLFINHPREFNEAHEIADVVESALRARNQ